MERRLGLAGPQVSGQVDAMNQATANDQGMTREEIALVQMSFAALGPSLDGFAAVLYARLFEKNPIIESIFRGDQTTQQARLTEMLGVVVARLDRFDELRPALRGLGRRHVTYGVRPKDYPVFEDALLWTLEKFLEARFTPEVKTAWHRFYAVVSGIMQDGAE